MNNRIIKFRVWDNKKSQWIHGPNERADLDGVNLFGECILLGGFMSVSLEELNDCVPCQFTGLIDKNGREIFENDIVYGEIDFREESEMGDKYTFTGEVYYKAPSFCGKTADFELDSYELEVIGNIFENKNLLNEKS